MESLSIMIEDLYYKRIENAIANYYNMEYINSSDLPIRLREDEDNTFYIDGINKSGEFHIKITKQSNGKYHLNVSAYGLKNKRR